MGLINVDQTSQQPLTDSQKLNDWQNNSQEGGRFAGLGPLVRLGAMTLIGGGWGAGLSGLFGAGAAGGAGAAEGGAAEGSSAGSGMGWKDYASYGMKGASAAMQPKPNQRRPQTGNIQLDNPEATQTGVQPQFFNPNQGAGQPGANSYYDLMLSLSDLGAKEKGLDKQYALAEEMRGTPMPGMRDAGRVTRAAHPLEFMNAAIRQGMGYSDRKKAISGQEALAQEIRRRIMEERARQQTQGQGTPIIPQQYDDGMSYSPYQET